METVALLIMNHAWPSVDSCSHYKLVHKKSLNNDLFEGTYAQF